MPDFHYLEERRDAIEAVVITHGHEDHLGALPWVLRKLGEDAIPVVYGRRLTAAMAKSKLEEHKLKTRVKQLEPGTKVQAGPFELEFVHMTHSIPDAAGVALKTPLGTVLFTGVGRGRARRSRAAAAERSAARLGPERPFLPAYGSVGGDRGRRRCRGSLVAIRP